MQIDVTTGTRDYEVKPAQPAVVRQEATVTITLDKADARMLFNFGEYATREDANWQGYLPESLHPTGVNLTLANGRLDCRRLIEAIGKATGRTMRFDL